MSNRYWVGGNGNFEETAHWSLNSGGTGGATVPTTGDTAYFDSSSYTSPYGVTVKINSEVLCLIAPITAEYVDLQVRVGGTLSLLGDLTGVFELDVYGIFTTNNYDIGLKYAFFIYNTATVTLGTSTISLLWDAEIADNSDFYIHESASVSAENSTIVITGTGYVSGWIQWYCGGHTFGAVSFIIPSVMDALYLCTSDTFDSLTISGDITTYIIAGENITVLSTLSLEGDTPGQLKVMSDSPGTPSTITKSSGTVNAVNCTLTDSIATGGATFNAFISSGCIDDGGNTGWIFEEVEVSYSDITAKLIPFVFSVSDAFALEFGNYYIRFIQDRKQIVKAYAAWETSINYLVGELRIQGGSYYRCLVNHASGTFADDLTSLYWAETEGATDLVYEIPSPYTAAQAAEIEKRKGYCQSADVLYLFHPAHAPRKLMRLADDEWQLNIVNFRPPPTIESSFAPAATLTPSAITGENILFTASAAVFLTGDATRMIIAGAARAIIKSFKSTTEVICDIIDDFVNTDVIDSGDWKMTGNPIGTLLPSISGPVNANMSLSVDDADLTGETWISINTLNGGNWELSGSGTHEYYLKNTAPFYTGVEPAGIMVDSLLFNKGTVGSLADNWMWGWGDNDGLGYNTIYLNVHIIFAIVFGWDPDGVESNKFSRSTTPGQADIFRGSDVGKYVYIYGGLIKITSILSPRIISGIMLKELDPVLDDSDNIEPTANWSLLEDLWSATNGYPSCGVFYEDRLVTSGVPAYPENVRGSAVGDYECFAPGIDDDDAYDFSIAGRLINTIHWIEPREYLILGSTGAEWRLGPEDSGQAMTPLNVIAKQQTAFGCADIGPLTIRNCTLFVQRALRKIREFTNNPNSINIEYVAPDLTMLAEHITEGKIAGMCYQQEPLSIVWTWMEDGTLASMTYLRDEDVIGWARHPISGTIESMCSIPADGYDEVYAIIKRTVNGVVIRSIEVLEKLFTDDTDTFDDNKGLNAFFVDCGITYNSDAATSIPVAHLIGEEVAILADGKVKANQTVDGDGNITLATAASVVHAGFPYNGKLTTMRPELDLKDGTSQGRMKRIIDLVIRVLNSGTFKAGRDSINLDEYGFATYDQTLYRTLFEKSDVPAGTPVSLFTGDKKVVYDGDFNRDARLTIVQDKPLPLTVVAIAAEVELP